MFLPLCPGCMQDRSNPPWKGMCWKVLSSHLAGGVLWQRVTCRERPEQRGLSRFSPERKPGCSYCPRKREMVCAIWCHHGLLPYKQQPLLHTSFSLPGHQRLHLAWGERGTMLVSLCPINTWTCLPMQTKAAEHRTNSLELGSCMGTSWSEV